MHELRANTAVDVLIGPFLDTATGDTDMDALTIEDSDVMLSKNGQPLAAKTDVTDCAADDLGHYNCELDATDTNTEGQLDLVVHVATALSVRHTFDVLSQAAWDSKYVAKDDGFMDVNIKTIGQADTTETEADNLQAACAAYSATRGLSGTALPAAAADALGGLPVSDAGELDLDAMNTAVLAVDTLTNADGDGDLAAILVDTGEIGTAGVGLTESGGDGDQLTEAGGDGDHLVEAGGTGDQLSDLGGMSTAMKAEVNAEAKDVLVTDTHAELTGVPAATANLADKVEWLFMRFRNKFTQSATTATVTNDAGTSIATSAVSDAASTLTVAEYT